MTVEDKQFFLDKMVGLQRQAYDDGMNDTITILIEVIDKMQRTRGLQVMTIDEIRKVLNDGKAAIQAKL